MKEYLAIGENETYKNPQPWVFKPILALRMKMFVVALLTFLIIFPSISLVYYLYLRAYDFILLIYANIILLVVLLLVLLAINHYYRSFEYQVHGTEIIIKKGLINITENHIPFSNITNIAIRKGPLDQLFGIGSILIYTAGKNGNPFSRTSIVGIKIFKDVGYFVLNQIRDFDNFFTVLLGEEILDKSNFPLTFWNEFKNLIIDIKILFNNKFG